MENTVEIKKLDNELSVKKMMLKNHLNYFKN